ncbi:MAG: hypothetical protein J2O48_10325 [Solirubrobacterales bacterium]|nr:hypothetical protein [Solirubrobacterales bacterium]
MSAAVALAVLLLGAGIAEAASGPGKQPARSKLKACTDALGKEQPAVRSIHGSADPRVLGAFGVLKQNARLPANADLRSALLDNSSTPSTYDPTHAGHIYGDEYLLPATLPKLATPHACARVPGMNAYLSVYRHERGSGPGVCVLSISARARPATSASSGCESLSLIDGYSADMLDGYPGPNSTVLAPDGVSRVDYVYRDGRTRSKPVVDNLVTAPRPITPRGDSAIGGNTRLLTRWLADSLPTEIRWRNAQGEVVATHHLPRGLLTTYVHAVKFLEESDG